MSDESKNKIIRNKIDELKNYTKADIYGITSDAYVKNKNVIDKIDNYVENFIKKYSKRTSDNNYKIYVFEELVNIVNKFSKFVSSGSEDLKEELNNTKSVSSYVSSMRDTKQIDLIRSFSNEIRPRFSEITEYANIISLIPDLKRVMKTIRKDILYPNFFSKNIFNEFFNSTKLSNEIVSDINSTILDIVTDYGLFKRIKRYVMRSLIKGASPVFVIPFSRIKEDLKELYSESNFSSESYSLENCIANFKNISTKTLNNSLYEDYLISEESGEFIGNSEEEIFDDFIINKYSDILKEEINRKTSIIDRRISSEDGLDSSIIMEIDNLKKYKNRLDSIKISLESGNNRESIVKNSLRSFVETIDKNISVVKEDKKSIYHSKELMHKLSRYSFLTPEVVNDLGAISNRSGKKYVEFTDDILEEEIENKTSNKTEKSKDSKLTLDNTVILLESEPEYVIPVIINGEHIGYYLVELSEEENNIERSRRRINTPSELMKGIGITNDSSALYNQAGMAPVVDPLDSTLLSPFNMMDTVMNNPAMLGGDGSNDENDMYSIMVHLIKNILSEKLKDKSVKDDKRFSEMVAYLIRNKYILEKKVNFSFFPVDNTVYFEYELDEYSLPVSIMKDSLFFCYIYIAWVMSSLMIKLAKASDKEKLMLNIGMSNQIGTSVDEILKLFFTKNLYSSTLFDNVASVIKNSSIYQLITVPVFNNEKLYDVEGLERINDISVDDEFGDKILKSILNLIGVPQTVLNKLSEDEYAKSITTQQAEYESLVAESKENYSNHITKLIRILMKYGNYFEYIKEKLSKKYPKEIIDKVSEELNIDNIDVKLYTSTALSMSNFNELVSTADDTVNNIVKIVVGENEETTVSKETVNKFKFEVYKKFINNVDWNEYVELYNSLKEESKKTVIENIKDIKISESIDSMKNSDESSGGSSDFESSSSGGGESGFGEVLGGFGGEEKSKEEESSDNEFSGWGFK